MTYYVRVGNATMPIQQAKMLDKKRKDELIARAARADEIRKDNIRASMGLEQKSQGVVPDVRPESEMSKAIAEDFASKAEESEDPTEGKDKAKKERKGRGSTNKPKDA